MSLVQSKKIVSLCTDFGIRDHRLALLKSAIYKSNNQVTLLDISHDVSPFDLIEAAFHLSNVLVNFPLSNIHIVWVFNVCEDEGIILALFKEQYIILPNNGLLGLLLNEEQAEKVYRISDDAYEYKERIAAAIHHILNEENLNEIFEEIQDPIRKISVKPVYQKDRIQARVIYIDRFGNIVFNILKKPFEETCLNRRFSFTTQTQKVISNFILEDFSLENGSFYISFTEAGYLVLALCGSNAARILDIEKEDTLQIEFQ
ncbi:MAG: SAM-dependent chlorinase/fluorinase [Saprospiraceae bacterium]